MGTDLFASFRGFPTKCRELEEAESVFALLESEQGTFISRGDHQIYASGASQMEAEVLSIKTKILFLSWKPKCTPVMIG